jgi:hypothetical protein
MDRMFRDGAGAAAAMLLAAAVMVLSWSVRAPMPSPAARLAADRPAVPASLAAPRAVLFEPNRGQAPRDVRWLTRGPRHEAAIFDDGVAFAGADGSGAQLRFNGARRGGEFDAREEAPSRVHHLIGNDAKRWLHGLPQFRQLRYPALYPGIDLVWYSRDGDLEFDFVVHPGADPSAIRLQVSGAGRPVIDADGRLRLDGDSGAIQLKRPVLHQSIDGQRIDLEARWVLGTEGAVTIDLPAYDRRHVLVIDPVFKLLYSTYLGGVHDEEVGAMVLDAQGNAYVVGNSGSEDWPVSGHAVQPARKNLGSYVRNVVVAKFDAAGTLLWSTFLGGSVNDYGRGIALDAKGQVVVSGKTHSADFPTTPDAMQRQRAGDHSAFLAVLSPDGSALVHSTLYGGVGGAEAFDIRLDAQGRLWAVGTAGTGLPTTAGSYKPTLAGSGASAFLARFSPPAAGPLQLQAATYYGIDNPPADRYFVGSNATSLDFAPGGGVWIAGQARHELLPLTADALMSAPTAIDHNAQIGALPLCAFGYVARLAADLSTLEYATYLTGYTREARDRSSCAEYARSVAVAGNGDVIVTGSTSSDKFPTTTGALQTAYPGAGGFIGHVGFATCIRADGRAIVWSTYIGGSGGDTFVNGVTLDRAGSGAWVHGVTAGGPNFPLSADALQAQRGGGTYDAGVTRLDAASGALVYSTFMGGSGDDNPSAIAIDAVGNAFIAGATGSRNFPVTATAFQKEYTPNAFDGNDWFFRIVGAGTIGSVRPSQGLTGGELTLSVATTGIAAGATAQLVAPGGAVFPATAVQAIAGAATRLTFNLDGAPTGVYALRIVNADGSSVTRAEAFTVADGVAAPDLSVQVIGRPKIRVGVPSTFQVSITNGGSADAYIVPVWIEVPEAIGFAVFGLTPQRSEELTTTEAGTRFFNHLVPRIPAGDTVTIPIHLTATTNLDSIPIRVSLQAPWFRNVADFLAEFPQFALGRYTPDCVPHPTHPQYSNCFGNYLQHALAGARALAGASAAAAGRERPLGGNSPCDPPVSNPFDQGKDDGAADARAGNSDRYNPPNLKNDPIGNFLYNVGYTTGVLNAVSTAAGGGNSGSHARERPLGLERERLLANTSCTVPPRPSPPPTSPPSTNSSSSSAGAIDPNDKYGPQGSGAPGHHLRQAGAMSYQIAFENLATAGLPAAEVVVTDQLDAATYDLTSLSLGAIAWGPHRIDVPPGLNTFSTVYPIDSTISVRVAGSLNPTTGVLKWIFTTIDPATRLPPSDPTLGFLPPNRNGTEGQAYVNFTIKSKTGLPEGTRWQNFASIVFDANAPIVTPTWVNTLDTTPPTSRVDAANQVAGETAVDVTWSGTDAGSGIARYTVHVSDNGGAYTAWQTDVSGTTARFTGTAGHTYAFYAVATDAAGNVEAAKAAAEAAVTVRDPAVDGGGGGGCTIGDPRDPRQRDASLVLALVATLVVLSRRRAARSRCRAAG